MISIMVPTKLDWSGLVLSTLNRVLGYLGWLLRWLLGYLGWLLGCSYAVAKVPGSVAKVLLCGC